MELASLTSLGSDNGDQQTGVVRNAWGWVLKNKWKGVGVGRNFSPHTNALICPVKAYLIYRKRTGKEDKRLLIEA